MMNWNNELEVLADEWEELQRLMALANEEENKEQLG